MKKKIIYHYPGCIENEGQSGSSIRPLKMLNAFKEEGYDVFEVTGDSYTRANKSKELLRNISNGVKYEFCYCENRNIPYSISDKSHLSFRPFTDFFLFYNLKKNNIPLGLFYRDIFWLLPEYKVVGALKSLILKILFTVELFLLNKLIKKFFVPSEIMVEYFPNWFSVPSSPLPPAFDEVKDIKKVGEDLCITYIGGFGKVYEMDLFIETMKKFPGIKFNLCTRKDEWDRHKQRFCPLSSNISIHHISGDELENVIQETDIFSLIVNPLEFWKFAVPVKLFTYMSFRKPIIMTKGVYVEKYLSDGYLGWSIDYNIESIEKWLRKISEDRSIVDDKLSSLKSKNLNHTWCHRVKQVHNSLHA